MFGDIHGSNKRRRINLTLEEQVTKYLDTTEEVDTDAITWWKAVGKFRYPALTVIARDYLAVPATSADSERVFSGGRLVVPYTRSSMHGEQLAELMTLKSWTRQKVENW